MRRIAVAVMTLALLLGSRAETRAEVAPPDPLRTQASDPAPDPASGKLIKKDGDWAVVPYTYLWLPRVNAKVDSADSGYSLTLDPSDVLKTLKLAYMGGVEVEYRHKWIAGLDLNFFDIGEDTEIGPVFRSVGPLQVRRGPAVITIPSLTATIGPLDADIGLRAFVARGLLGYRLLSRPMPEFLGGGPGGKRAWSFDALAGGRLWVMRNAVDIDGPGIGLPATMGTISFPSRPNINLPGFRIPATSADRVDIRSTDTVAWIDPIVGGRVRADLSDRIVLRLAGNIGGFDWGSASKLDWETVMTFGVRFKERWTAEAGYRALALERVAGDVQADIIMHGPVMGLSYRY